MPAERRLPVRFPTAAWQEDLASATTAAQQAARTARHRYERHGISPTELRRVELPGPDGTELEHCVKVYLPPPAGRWGMVLQFTRDHHSGELLLVYIAFGVRHHPADSHAETVYQRAHRRLHPSTS
jgi:hypothetical protein